MTDSVTDRRKSLSCYSQLKNYSFDFLSINYLHYPNVFPQCGYRVTINTVTGVGTRDTVGQFVRLQQDPMLLHDWPMESPSRFVNKQELQVCVDGCRIMF